MKIYMDVCCLCRPFDNQLIPRIRYESEAVIAILNRVHWIGNWSGVPQSPMKSLKLWITRESTMSVHSP